ncbi:Down syndrome cell adhesion molecule-like protein 1 [Thelohanellus kitauei]|uniref:Down syndrome cell adhesion molecule-like protein 1 n=1 Tax=Thelohanellus kitauei TaxID=669202 RepID=A0A0C2MPA9_THEKT|nr:Down syndrome cell adhesion molecule-like protein 1 [Thelohanellus kitauei]KII69056.1 Down syndrome cell adhesion molecule-like protein 1 [Thelohanellus kitauei]
MDIKKLESEAEPQIIKHSETIECSIGENITVNCDTLGFPSPAIHWTFLDNRSGVIYSNVGFEKNGNLKITNFRTRNQGFYECTARNGAGYDTMIVHIVIQSNNILDFRVHQLFLL